MPQHNHKSKHVECNVDGCRCPFRQILDTVILRKRSRDQIIQEEERQIFHHGCDLDEIEHTQIKRPEAEVNAEQIPQDKYDAVEYRQQNSDKQRRF